MLPRREGVEYDVDHAVHPAHGDVWLVRSNHGPNDDKLENFAVFTLAVGQSDPAALRPLLPYRPEVKVESVEAFARHALLLERFEGLEQLRALRLSDGDEHVVAQPEPAYTLSGDASLEWDTDVVRFGYSSLVSPPSSIEYNMESRERVTLKQATVGGGYDPADYRSARVWAEAPDGALVPISLVCRREQELDGSAPCLLYGYGSYEITIDPAFSQTRLNLLERGFVFAIAHVRGGGEMGRPWYEQGRLMNKMNTFKDFIACAEKLIADGWTAADRLVIRGGSAGGLLMGAVTNMRPDLFSAVVAEVPFVDVVTTMSDESLPLTVTEWEEWGNPRDDPAAYFYMKSYSPYDNVQPVDYPSIYVTAGLNDPRVGYWEPAKWVAKLRATKTDHKPLLLRTEMGAGHQGPSGRYDTWRDEARVQSFMLSALGANVTEDSGATVAQKAGRGRAVSWAEWAEAKNAKTQAKGRWRKLADFDAIGPRGSQRGGAQRRPQRRLLRLQRLSRALRTPQGARGGTRGDRPMGRRRRRLAPGQWVATGPQRAGGSPGRLEIRQNRPWFSRPASPPTWVCCRRLPGLRFSSVRTS